MKLSVVCMGAAALLLAAAAGGQVAPQSVRVWPQIESDVPADPDVHFGTLPSGMRYAIQRNTTPAGQVSLRLHVASGSIQESPTQRGLAHFLEHMAFRGSKSVPDGEVWKSLERLGLKMGADTNAYTGQTETVYKFDLAHNDDASLDTGLRLLRETGDSLNLDAAAFDAERGVVLSELRLNDNPSGHMAESLNKFLLPGQLASERLPIGKRAVLETAPVYEVRQYYRDWYRPSRATLVVVGDVDVENIEAKLKAMFGTWQETAPTRLDPPLGAPARRRSSVAVHVEAGAPSLTAISWVDRFDNRPDSVARETRDLTRQVALAIVNRRLEAAAASAQRHFSQAHLEHDARARSADITTLVVSHEAGAWRAALSAAEALRREVLEHGVRADEMTREVAALRTRFAAEAAGAGTRLTPQLADTIVGTLDSNEVYTSPSQDVALSERVFSTITVSGVNDALRNLFKGSGPHLFVSSPVPIGGGARTLRQALRVAETRPVVATRPVDAAEWPYTRFGTAGAVAERRELDDLGVTQIVFANSVRLNVKPTRFAADQVLVNVNVGTGRVGIPRDLGKVLWAAGAVVQGGTGRLDYSALQRVLADKNYHVSFQIGDGAVALPGQTTPRDLVTQLQVLAAYVSDAGWRQEAFEQQRSELLPQLGQIQSIPMALFQTQLPGLLHGGDARWAFPSVSDVKTARAEDLQAVLAPQLASGPIEVAIVGDVAVDAAIAAVADTFGALPPRVNLPEPPVASVEFPQPRAVPEVVHHAGAVDQGIAAIAWPTTDAFAGLPLGAARLILADVIQQRLFEAVRVQAGTSYTAQAYSQSSTVIPGRGILLAFADMPPDKDEQFFAAVKRIVDDLQREGPTADEFDRARNPSLAKASQARETNGYWLGILAGLQAEPRYAELARHALPDLDRVTRLDVQRAAREYLRDDRAWRLVVVPGGAGGDGSAVRHH